MKSGVLISILLHTGAFWVGALALSEPADISADSRIVPVEILTVADLTNIRASIKDPAKAQAEKPQNPMTLKAPMKNADQVGEARDSSAKNIMPAPTPVQEDDKVAEVERPKPKPKKPVFDLENMSALIDKTRAEQPEKNQQKALQSEKNLYEFAEMSREHQGLGNDLKLSELDALKSSMYRCWRIPLDAKNPEELVIKVSVSLRSDGHVTSAELVDQAAIARSPNPYMVVAAQRAVSAVSKCAPYDFLPLDKYDKWKEMTLTFKPEL